MSKGTNRMQEDNKRFFWEFAAEDKAFITFLVTGVVSKTDVNGNAFIDVEATDGEQSTVLKMWNRSAEEVGLVAGMVITAKVSAKDYRGNISLSFRQFSEEKTVSAANFLMKPPIGVSVMWGEIKARIENMEEPYKTLTSYSLENNKDEYRRWAASKSLHHGYNGGLLYHSYRMMEAGDKLALVYSVNADLVVAGALLHDIGKLRELTTDWMGNADYTVEGKIEGHLQIGVRMLDEACDSCGIEKNEHVRMLRHVIASHHGTLEYGALHEPMTKEAMLVHQLDMIDMMMTVYDEVSFSLEPGQVSLYENKALGHRIYVPKYE